MLKLYNLYSKLYWSEIKPSKDDLGTITITYADGKQVAAIQPDQYEITGYTNNVDATVYKDIASGENRADYLVGGQNTAIKSQAAVTIKLTGKSFNGETVSVPFNILPLKVTADDIKVPSTYLL